MCRTSKSNVKENHDMRNKKIEIIILVLLVGYYIIVLHYTIFSRLPYYGSHIELRPFRFIYYTIKNIKGTYDRFLTYGFSATPQMHNISVVFDFLLNIIIFIPIGFMIKILNKPYNKISYVLIGFFLSLVIELLELITHRGCFELDDLISNTMGVCIGAFLWNTIVSMIRNIFT